MTKAGKTLRIGRCRYFGIEEQGVWALLLVAIVIEGACAFGALADQMAGDSPQVAMTQAANNGSLLAGR